MLCDLPRAVLVPGTGRRFPPGAGKCEPGIRIKLRLPYRGSVYVYGRQDYRACSRVSPMESGSASQHQ